MVGAPSCLSGRPGGRAVKEETMGEDRNLFVVGVDGSENSRRAVEYAAGLAKRAGASLLLVHVVSWSAYTPLSVEEALHRPVEKKEEERIGREKVLDPLKRVAEEAGAGDVEVETFLTWGHPAAEIVQIAKDREAEMIIVARRGHSVLLDIVLGSVANAVAHMADRPVMLVP
ncbi:MAG: universal stress protein [Alphaproteobacteria bacterium]|nr:MAG: universal stress protein [Alphaproteobacteria bacterium]